MQTQTISRPRASLSPHQNRTENPNPQNKPKLRLSSFETASRIYDNKGYATHLHKMFDAMNKSPSRKPSPNKSRMISSSFVNPMLNSSSHDIPAPLAESLLTEGLIGGSEAVFPDLPSGSILPTVSRGNLSRGKHKRTASMLTPPSEIITVKDSRDNTRKIQRTPLSFLGDSPIDLLQHDSLTQKQRKESPFIRTQLFHYSTQSTKNERLAVTPNRRVMIAAPSRCKPDSQETSGRSPIRSILDSAKKDENSQVYANRMKGYAKRSPLVSWKQTDDDYQYEEDVAFNDSMLPNMEDMLIIKHEMQGSQTSLILTTSEDFDREDFNGSMGNRREANKRGIIKKYQANNERAASNKHVSIMNRTMTPKSYGDSKKDINTIYGARQSRGPSGSPFARSRKEVGNFERQTLAVEVSYSRSRDYKQRSNSRPQNITEESEWQLTTKLNESGSEFNPKGVSIESPLKIFRKTQQSGFYTNTTPKKPVNSSAEKRLEYKRPEHRRGMSMGGASMIVNSGRKD